MPASDPINPAAPIVASGLRKSIYSNEELLACGRGELFGSGNAQLPLPPMLMFDRIVHVDGDGLWAMPNAHLPSDRCGRADVIAGDHLHGDARGPAGGHRTSCLRTRRIGHAL